MKTRLFYGLVLSAAALAAAPAIPRLIAADNATAAPDKAAKGKGRGDGPHGRLPPHYADLVNAEQKAKIYAIQAEHEPEIQKLETALKEARAKRDAAVAAVLTPAQQEQLAKLEAEGKAKRKGKAMDGDQKPAEGDSAKKSEKTS